MAGHVKTDLDSRQVTDSLLTVCLSQFTFVEPGEEIQGAYLYYDRENGVFVRSGKAAPTFIYDRGEQHKAAAKISNAGFYGKYPDISNMSIRSGLRRGFFHHLQMLYAIGFDGSSVDHLISTAEDGVFEWDATTMDCVLKSGMNASEKGKQVQMVAYLLELVYDIMISTNNKCTHHPQSPLSGIGWCFSAIIGC